MTLYTLQHARHLASAQEALRFYRALGETHVQVSGCNTRAAAQITRFVAVLPTRGPHTVSFEGGRLTALAREALAQLVLASYEYLDVRSQNADLRCWPALYSWVHAQADRTALARALGAELVDSSFVLGELRGTFHSDGRPYPVDIETRAPQPAWRIFDALSSDVLRRGFLRGAQPDSHPHLVRLLIESGSEVQIDAVLPLEVACQLTNDTAGAEGAWQSSGVLVAFPDGIITGSLTSTQASETDEADWHARIDEVLRKAGL